MLRTAKIMAVLVFFALCGSASAVEDGMVSHWNFDEGSGSTAYDSVGDNHGTVYGAEWTTGQIDGALSFDGAGDYVEVSSSEELKLNLTGAISVWIYPHDLYRHSIVNKRGGSGSGNKNENYWLTFGSSNQCMLHIGDGSTYVSAEIAAENFSVNSWYHVVGTWNSSNIMIYLNGELQDIQTNTLSYLISSDSYPVRIGEHDSLTWSFDGKIDDVRIYDRTLPAEEVWQLYQEGAGGLVSHWKFDEGEGDIAYDSVGDNHGTLIGDLTWTSGIIDGALSFDGVDDYVDMGNPSSLRPSNEITVTSWFKPSINNISHRIVNKYTDSSNKDYRLWVYHTNDKFYFDVYNSSGTLGRAGPSDVTLEVGKWYFLAGTWDGSTVKLYLNSVLQTTTASLTGPLGAGTAPDFFIGYDPDKDNYANGIIDDVRIYERALSEEEVWELYQEGRGGLISHWKFDEGEGTIAYDSAGDNHGTIYGAEWTTGIIDGALNFDGDGDCVQASEGDELKLNLTGAISAWVYPHDLYQHTIVEKKGAPGGGNKYENYFLSFGSSNQCVLHIGDGSTYVSAEIAAENFSVNSWYHVVGTWNSSNIMIYLDGELQDIQDNTLSYLISSDSYPVRIGEHDSLTWSFDGKIDDVRIYEQALSAEEIEELYQEGLGDLVELEIIGPKDVAEDFTASYKAIAYYDDESTKDVTGSADWLVEPNLHASIENGLLTTEGINRPEEDITIYAQYTEGDVTVEAEKQVSIFAVCPTGTALQFDGDEDYVVIPDDDSLTPSSEITISFWLYNRGGQAAGIFKQALCPNEQHSPGNSRAYALCVSFANGGKARLRIYSSRDNYDSLNGNTVVPLNEWHHIAGTFNQGEAKVYVDGQLDNSTTLSVSSIMNDAQPLIIGGYWSYCGTDNFANGLNGKIDDLMLFDRALSAEEIQANVHTRLTGDEPGLVGYWDFDEGEGQIAYDLSPYDNHGSLGTDPCEPDASDPAWIESVAPIGICTLEGFVEQNISDALDIKLAILEQLAIALAKEKAVVDTLNTSFKNRDFGDVKKRDVVKAKQKIRFAIKHEKQAGTAVDKSIEKLEDSLSVLGYEVEAQSRPQPETEEEEAVIRADINADGVVDFRDFAILMNHWLESYETE